MCINICQYIQHLFEVGGGLNLDAIRLNKIESVTYYDLTDDVIDEICNVMKKNKSIKEFNTDWGNLTDEQIKNTNSPFNLFTGSYYSKQFTKGEIDDLRPNFFTSNR